MNLKLFLLSPRPHARSTSCCSPSLRPSFRELFRRKCGPCHVKVQNDRFIWGELSFSISIFSYKGSPSVRNVTQDSYTDGGRHDGGYLAPAVVVPPDTFAGGRSTNGKVWVEHLADKVGARLMDYAVSSTSVHIYQRSLNRCLVVECRDQH